MKPESFLCAGIHELDEIAAQILDHFPNEKVFAISGSMGAGKTTFIQALCRKLLVTDTVTSPTFSLVNEYRTSCNNPVFHFDLYRLRKPEELLDIGYEEYFYSGNYCFIEWPENAGNLIPEGCLYINITVDELTKARYFNVTK
ncbi:MAG: tRNA (adenosine(37)-N6)-threonylcarbamoyltransferase complex ATPase subunit type 1 TsaE [Lentimicrobium sp.]|nr:tRNA (adenosine(37)-N6)-threonylcarbamoyltransferase complex ATPase subunit type 1 TsaE [Lentimicrobium sp.]